jgi:hypothetical protein
MRSNQLAFAAVGIACVIAAGGGSYLATRHSAPSVEAAGVVEPASLPGSAPSATSPTPLPVQETEAVVGDAPKPVPPAAAAAPARKAATPTRIPPPKAPSPASASATNSAQPPSLDRTWPNSAAPAPSTDGGSSDNTGLAPRDEHPVVDTPRAVEPPQETFQELVVSANSVIGLQNERALSSERARIEDSVEARVARDVRVDGQVAIPAGTRALGSVLVVERGGKFKDRARLGIRFHTLVMADGTRLPITTETVYRYGEAPGNGSAAKIGGGAAIGTILGAIIGGGKGAAIGAAAGAGAGTATAASGDRSEASFPAGVDFTARVLSPVTVTLEK